MAEFLKNNTWEKHQIRLFVVFISAIIMVGVIYIYCVTGIVMKTVNQNKNLQSLQILKKECQNLEQNYLSLISKLDLDYAYSLGFVAGNNLIFISRQTSVAQNTNSSYAP